MKTRVWVVSELYYPEQSATGYFLTRIAEGLAAGMEVHVLCGQPTYSLRGVRARVQEVKNGVHIRRCSSTTFDKDKLVHRVANLVTISISIFVQALFRIRRGDRVLVVTNPPALPFLVSLACKVRKAECVLLIHDVFPELLVVTGIIESGSLLLSALHRLNGYLFRNVAHIVVIGRDMQDLIRRKLGRHAPAMSFIPNWADVEQIVPKPRGENPILQRLGVDKKFVIQSSGNMARYCSVETMVQGAELLKNQTDIHFVFVGLGFKKPWLERTIREKGLAGVSVLPPQPRETLCDLLNAADVALIGLVSGMSGISVPSRLYNVLAAGKPIIALAEPHSELARVVLEETVGWVVDPNDPSALASAILEAKANPERLTFMGRRARVVAEQKYRFDQSLNSFRALLQAREASTSRSWGKISQGKSDPTI